ncbi:universal stress protein [Solimonas marina]|uniref:Universal stress protein n=1 Tax=Solimonas marina TaxID=2714601 RepID=A0A970B9Q4_9GAMM|nr:universal stress protein [Solimonas marina]NKF23589.1 universal stress protein [Solimonas marina]
MDTVRHIVAIVDPQMRETAALRRAAALARRGNAALYLLMCAYDAIFDAELEVTDPRVQEMAKAHWLEQRRQWLDARAEALIADGLDVRVEVVWAPRAHEAILMRSLALKPDLVIKDLLPRRGSKLQMPMTSGDWRLARSCPAPLMFVRQDQDLLPQRIAAAVDVSPDANQVRAALNERVALLATSLAAQAGAEVRLVYALPYLRPTNAVAASRHLRELYDHARTAAADAFRTFAAQHEIAPDRADWLQRDGDPALMLSRYVETRHIDLLVVGSAYHTIIGRFLLGSVSEDLLRQLRCDVLLVKPEDFVAQLASHHDLERLRRHYGDTPQAAATATAD